MSIYLKLLNGAKKVFQSPTTLIFIAAMAMAGYYQVQIHDLKKELKTATGQLAEKDVTITNLTKDYENLAKINLDKDVLYNALTASYVDMTNKYNKSVDKVKELEVQTANNISQLNDYRLRMSDKMLISKPTLLQNKIREASKKAYLELHEITNHTMPKKDMQNENSV